MTDETFQENVLKANIEMYSKKRFIIYYSVV